MTFYDNINEFFTKNGYIKNIIDEPTINIFQSKIIKEYKNILKGSDDYFEEILIQVKHKISRAKYVGRVDCASPATGYGSYHSREQKKLIDEALIS
jgi:hypothetical protein